MGQIEIDEIYVGVNRNRQQFVIPVQANGGNDQLAIVQTRQDLACCAEKFPALICRAISAQFMSDEENTIAIFELTLEKHEVKVVEERHYRLVPGRFDRRSRLGRIRETMTARSGSQWIT